MAEQKNVPEVVGGGYGGYGGTGSMFGGFEGRQYVNDETNQKITIFFFKGRPLSRIPSGFRPVGETIVDEQKEAQQASTEDPQDRGIFEDTSNEWINKKPSEYSIKDFKNYGDYYSRKKDPLSLSGLETGALMLAGGSLLGRALGSGGGKALIEKTLKGTHEKAIDISNRVNSILTAGVDTEGNPLNSTSNNILFRAKINADIIDMSYRKKYDLGPGQTVGVGIDEQPFFQTEDGSLDVEKILPDPDDKPSGGLDYNPTSSVFKTKYERDEALQGNLGARASYLASQEVASQGLKAKGLPDTTVFGFNVGPLEATKNLVKYGSISSPDMDPTSPITPKQQAAADKIMAASAMGSTVNVTQEDRDALNKDDDKCVIATHGISTGGFSLLEKAKAELWCKRTYHDKWYGEAFRRGYRYAGNRAIEKGKAAEHYQEFKDFVSYGRGLKKGLKPAINYYLRTTQFFLTGLFVK